MLYMSSQNKLICILNSIWIGQWESDENQRVNLEGGELNSGGWISEKNANFKNAIPKLFYVGSFIQIGQRESVQN